MRGRWVAKLSAVGAAAGLAVALSSTPSSAANDVYYGTYSPLSKCDAMGRQIIAWHTAKTYQCDHEAGSYYSLWYHPA